LKLLHDPHREQTSFRRNADANNIEDILARGRKLWNSIYEPHADKLYSKLGSYHPDFICKSKHALSISVIFMMTICFYNYAAFIIQSYGSVLAPLPTLGQQVQGNLSRALGSVVGVACLRTEERVGPQLVSHVFGLLRARYVEDQSPEDAWISSDEGAEWVIRTVDKTVDGLNLEQEPPQSRVKL
jgi:hypothetical protein